MHSQEEARIREQREETDLQVALHSERESIELLQMMDIHRALGIPLAPNEQEFREMMNPSTRNGSAPERKNTWTNPNEMLNRRTAAVLKLGQAPPNVMPVQAPLHLSR